MYIRFQPFYFKNMTVISVHEKYRGDTPAHRIMFSSGMRRKDHKLNSEVDSNDCKKYTFSFSNCFGRCLGKRSDLEKQQTQAVTAIEKERHFDAETERRIRTWLLDSSLSYGDVSEYSENSDNYRRQDSEMGDGHECSDSAATKHPGKPPLATDGASAPAQSNEQNRRRWRG